MLSFSKIRHEHDVTAATNRAAQYAMTGNEARIAEGVIELCHEHGASWGNLMAGDRTPVEFMAIRLLGLHLARKILDRVEATEELGAKATRVSAENQQWGGNFEADAERRYAQLGRIVELSCLSTRVHPIHH